MKNIIEVTFTCQEHGSWNESFSDRHLVPFVRPCSKCGKPISPVFQYRQPSPNNKGSMGLTR